MQKNEMFKALQISAGGKNRGLDWYSIMPGDRVTGRVLEVSPDGQAIIGLGKLKVRARVDFKVQQGQLLKLVVVKAGQPLWLKTISGDRGGPDNLFPAAERVSADGQTMGIKMLAAWLKSEVPEPPLEIRKAFLRIIEILSPLDMDGPESGLADKLRQILENGGHFFEARAFAISSGPHGGGRKGYIRSGIGRVMAKDLKAVVHAAANWLEGKDAQKLLDAGQKRSFQALLESIGRRIEGRQKKMLLTAGNLGDGILLDLQIPIAGLKQPVKFSVFYPKRKHGNQESGHRVSLLLELEHLGPLRADVALKNEHLSLYIYVSKREIAAMVEKSLPVLLASLREDFSLVESKVLAEKQEVERIRRRFRQDPEKGIDLLV